MLPKELYMEQDHQAHVKAYWRHRFILAAKQFVEPVRVWQCPTRPAYRNPTPQQDPAAYTYGFE